MIHGSSDLESSAQGQRFDAQSERQLVTEPVYNKSLADFTIWSTIKTLLATLPQPTFVIH